MTAHDVADDDAGHRDEGSGAERRATRREDDEEDRTHPGKHGHRGPDPGLADSGTIRRRANRDGEHQQGEQASSPQMGEGIDEDDGDDSELHDGADRRDHGRLGDAQTSKE